MRVNPFYRILILSYSASVFAEGVLLPIYAVFVQKIGGDILDASGAMATFLIAQGLFTITAHRLHWVNQHRMIVMIGGWAIWVGGIAMYLVAKSVPILFLTQIFVALGNALADPIFDQELANHTDIKSQEFEWGFFEGSRDLVQGVAAIIGGLIASFFGFRVLIFTMVVFATLSLLLILSYVSRAKPVAALPEA